MWGFNLTENNEIVIIGCGASGGTTAQFARKTNRKANITILEKENYSQYSKCGLPYVISNIIPKVDNLIEFSEEWFKKQNMDLKLGTIVEKIDTKKNMVIYKKNNNTIEKPYTSLIICTGAKPSIPPIKNISENGKLIEGVFTIRTIDDAKKVKSSIKKQKNIVIIGAGLIGLEMADSLHRNKKNVTVIEALPNILQNTLDKDMGKILLEKIPENIMFYTNHIAEKLVIKNGKIKQIIIKDNKTKNEKQINTECLIIATGTKPNTSLAKTAGCNIGNTGGIKVDQRCETNIKNIYSAGDCTEYPDFITGEPVLIGLGSIAVRQGIAAGINAAGGEYALPQGVLQTRTSDFFKLEIAAVGPVTDCLDNKSVITGKYTGLSLPEYYPGGKPVTIKVLADKKQSQILGAQCIGDNAAQRIDTFACAIMNNMNIEDFRKLETAYAPSVAPTLDAETLVCDIISMKLKRLGK